MTKPIAALLSLAALLAAGDANGQAQYVIPGGHAAPPILGPDPAVQSYYARGYSSAYAPAPVTAPAGRVYPYSYYVAFPNPARTYVPYGTTDEFPFQGRSYGHPYDPWSWNHLSGGYYNSLARYYDPPVK